MNPYVILGVSRHADDQAIRRAYLDALKQAPPETHRQRFQELTAAYDKIKDRTRRYQYELLNLDCPGDSPADAFLRHVRTAPRPAPLPFEALKELLHACSRT